MLRVTSMRQDVRPCQARYRSKRFFFIGTLEQGLHRSKIHGRLFLRSWTMILYSTVNYLLDHSSSTKSTSFSWDQTDTEKETKHPELWWSLARVGISQKPSKCCHTWRHQLYSFSSFYSPRMQFSLQCAWNSRGKVHSRCLGDVCQSTLGVTMDKSNDSMSAAFHHVYKRYLYHRV